MLRATAATTPPGSHVNRGRPGTIVPRRLRTLQFRPAGFDVLLADEAPWLAAAAWLGAAWPVRERIMLSGDQRDITAAGLWTSRESQLRRSMPLA